MFYYFTLIEGMHIYERNIKSTFVKIEISKDSIDSAKDYLDDELWEYTELTDTHAAYKLVVDETHFE